MIQFCTHYEIQSHREFIDADFPAALYDDGPKFPPGSIGLEFFSFIFADFTLWLDYPWILDVNDDIDNDLQRLLKICRQADEFRLPRITLDKYRRHLIEDGRKQRRSHTRRKPTKRITRLRHVVDHSLSAVTNVDLPKLRRRLGRWLREEFSPRMLIEFLEDEARLDEIEAEGRRRNHPDFDDDLVYWLPRWKYWAEWQDALPCRPFANPVDPGRLTDLLDLDSPFYKPF